MPTVLRIGPYRFYFYSSDGLEPAHIHVERDDCVAKYWLDPVRLAKSRGFTPAEQRTIEDLVVEHRLVLQEAWDEYFGD
jgi:Domain of unknown function (DUF4160)